MVHLFCSVPFRVILNMPPQVGSHADSLIAEAVLKGMTGFDLETAWEAVYNDATVPPVNDTTTVWV